MGRQVPEPLAEAEIAKEIPRAASISDDVSREVRAQYETKPSGSNDSAGGSFGRMIGIAAALSTEGPFALDPLGKFEGDSNSIIHTSR